MLGSQKQIKWAEDIKSGMDFDGMRQRANGHPIGIKAVDFVEGIEHAAFWIDYRDYTAEQLIYNLMTSGLQVKGFGFADVAELHPDGQIVFRKIQY